MTEKTRTTTLPNTNSDAAPNIVSNDTVTRRSALRTVAQTAAIGTVGLSSLANAATLVDEIKWGVEINPLDKNDWVAGRDGVLVFVDDWEGVSNRDMQAVTLLNTSDQAVELSEVNPGLISAHGLTFNLNHVLQNGSVTLMPNEPRSFGLYPVDVTNVESLVSSKHPHVNTLVTCTPHTKVVDGYKKATQYAVIV